MDSQLFQAGAAVNATGTGTSTSDAAAAAADALRASSMEVLRRVESASAALLVTQLRIARQRESDAMRMYSTFQGLPSVPPADLRHAEARVDGATRARRALEQQVARLAAKDRHGLRRADVHPGGTEARSAGRPG